MAANTRTRTCQWCGIVAATVTAHMIHLHDEHPESIGRGPTMSHEWSCDCSHKNRPITSTCEACGATNARVAATNAAREFVAYFRRHPSHTLEQSSPMPHNAAATMAHFSVARVPGAVWNERRLEVWSDGRRIAWLEVAAVEHGTKYVAGY